MLIQKFCPYLTSSKFISLYNNVPLLIRFSDTGENPENLNVALEDINATPEHA